MSIVSLVIAPTLAKVHHDQIINNRNEKMHALMLMSNDSTSRNTGNYNGNEVDNRRTITDAEITQLTNALKTDGIITKSKFTVAVKNNELYINNIKQSTETNRHYRKYFDGKKDFVDSEVPQK